MRKLISHFKQLRLIQQIKNVSANSNVSKFIDIKLKNIQEDALVIKTEQILTLNLIQAMNEDVTVQSDTLVVGEDTITQSNISVTD